MLLPSTLPTKHVLSIALVFSCTIFISSLFWFSDSLALSDWSRVQKIPHFVEQTSHTASPPWLLATISAVEHIQRRQMIRSTWQHLFKDPAIFETRFVLSKPNALWEPLIQRENDTHGDLIILDHEDEDNWWANRAKTIYFFKHLGRNYSHANWQFVSKCDEDTWIDARNFWRLWLQPRVDTKTINGTYIGRPVFGMVKWTYAQGGFYTLSRDMVTLLAQLHDEHTIDDEHEDILIARLFAESGTPYTLTQLPFTASFDFWDDHTREDGSAWGPQDDTFKEENHALGPGALAPHRLKSDEDYLRVAACYNSTGLMEEQFWDYVPEEKNEYEEWVE